MKDSGWLRKGVADTGWIEAKLVIVAVSARPDSEISYFEFLDGKIRGGACGMFCRCCSHDPFEWSFIQFGSAV